MAGDASNGESKFGFKDKAKAEETLQILENHDMQYRKLTVRGLLGRAKRVLTMTKSEEKIKNIQEAMGIFEKWLEENGGGAANKNSKTDNEDKVETVPGLGFKDKEAAENTLKNLQDRDPEYQKLAVKGLIGSSKRVLAGTKNEEKIISIKEGVQILEDFLEEFDKKNMSRLNKAYLAYDLIKKFDKSENIFARDFLEAYSGEKAKGNYKHLRTMYPKDDNSKSWDIVRNLQLKKLSDEMEKDNLKLFKENGEPTEIHLKMIHWAYSPQPDKIKSLISNQESRKRKSSGKDSDITSSDDDDDDDENDSEDDVPVKKMKSNVLN